MALKKVLHSCPFLVVSSVISTVWSTFVVYCMLENYGYGFGWMFVIGDTIALANVVNSMLATEGMKEKNRAGLVRVVLGGFLSSLGIIGIFGILFFLFVGVGSSDGVSVPLSALVCALSFGSMSVAGVKVSYKD